MRYGDVVVQAVAKKLQKIKMSAEVLNMISPFFCPLLWRVHVALTVLESFIVWDTIQHANERITATLKL